jgi:hypothetical protein
MAAQQRRRAHGQCLSKSLAEAWVWVPRAGKALLGRVSPLAGSGPDPRWAPLEECRSAPLRLATQGARTVAETVQAMVLGYRAGARVCRTWSGPPGCSSHKKPLTLAPFHGRAGQSTSTRCSPPTLSLDRMPSTKAGLSLLRGHHHKLTGGGIGYLPCAVSQQWSGARLVPCSNFDV